MKIKVIDKMGKEKEEVSIFTNFGDKKTSNALLNQALVTYLSNQRKSTANTQTRSEVTASGRKPWKQKGTGRARVGAVSSPIWRGGGVIFGPTSEINWKKDFPKKMSRKAVIGALLAKQEAKNVLVIEELKLDKISTKSAQEMLNRLPFEDTALIVSDEKSDIVKKSFRNIPYVKVISYNNVNVYDILSNKYIIFTKKSVELLENYLQGKKTEEKKVNEKPVKEKVTKVADKK